MLLWVGNQSNGIFNLQNCVWMWQQIKVASVKLARVYMTRVAAELEHLAGSDREPVREFLLLQGVRFAFRVHQVQNSFLSF